MNIIEATRKALDEKKCIRNRRSPGIKMEPDLLMPFDVMKPKGSGRAKCWNPTGEDILSEDWEICD